MSDKTGTLMAGLAPDVSELRATLTENCTVYPDAKGFILHAGETYDIDRIGNGGVIILTPFGPATLPWRCFRWSELERAL